MLSSSRAIPPPPARLQMLTCCMVAAMLTAIRAIVAHLWHLCATHLLLRLFEAEDRHVQPFKHFYPHFPDSDPSLLNASSTFMAFVFR